MKRSHYIYLAIFAIACSVLIFETILLKFFDLKLMGSWAFLVVSVAFLGIGASGTYLYLKQGTASPDINFSLLSRFSTAYVISIPLSIILFVLLPFYPPQAGVVMLPGGVNYQAILFSFVYMLIFAVPFFLSGICISYTLSLERIHAGRILFFDLMGAGLGAVLAILFLGKLGGYGILALAMVFAYIASCLFRREAQRGISFNKLKVFGPHFLLFVVLLSGLLIYPSAMIKFRQFDIVAPKTLEGAFKLFTEDFNGLETTYWDPIARIDLSREGATDDDAFLQGLSPKYLNKTYEGRYILVDSGCMTRQFKLDGEAKDNEFLGHFLFSIPYQLKKNINNMLVIGAGGGIEISVAKHFQTKQVDVVEINAATVAILKGENKNDPLSDIYSAFTTSDNQTTVNYYNEEGRSFLSREKAPQYDILQLTGVDLLTALKSGGLILSENYLYTQEALEYYYDALKEGGYAQITYWSGPHALRLFITSLAMLEAKGQTDPHLSLVAVTDKLAWTNLIIKKGLFSAAELQKIREIAEADDFEVLFDSEVRQGFLEQIRQFELGLLKSVDIEYGLDPTTTYFEKGAYFFASVSESQLPKAPPLENLPFNLTPTHDNKPFFYSIYKPVESIGSADLATTYTNASQNKVAQRLILVGTILAFLLILLPLFLKRFGSEQLRKIPIPFELIVFFGVVGVAFSLLEIVLIQKFSIFVGGPFYSMCVTLPVILIFYSLGALAASRIRLPRLWLLAISIGGIVSYGVLGHFFFDGIINSLFYLGHFGRIMLTVVVISPIGFFLGFPTPLVLEAIKRKISKTIVPVMWGVNSCGNVVGALFFASISQVTGFNLLLLIASLLYLGALVCLILFQKLSKISVPL